MCWPSSGLLDPQCEVQTDAGQMNSNQEVHYDLLMIGGGYPGTNSASATHWVRRTPRQRGSPGGGPAGGRRVRKGEIWYDRDTIFSRC